MTDKTYMTIILWWLTYRHLSFFAISGSIQVYWVLLLLLALQSLSWWCTWVPKFLHVNIHLHCGSISSFLSCLNKWNKKQRVSFKRSTIMARDCVYWALDYYHHIQTVCSFGYCLKTMRQFNYYKITHCHNPLLKNWITVNQIMFPRIFSCSIFW